MFPKEVLYSVLKARHPRRPAGHWVVMKTAIAGVDLFAMVYAWSQSSVAYMVSTCGKTIRHIEDYYSKFSDGYDNKETNAYPRPAIAHQIWHFLPLIDEFNKERQKMLALEKKWPTRNCWTRCITSMTGQCVVDLMRWDRAKRNPIAIGYTEEYKEWDITEMANKIARPLLFAGGLGATDRRAPRRSHADALADAGPLTRVRGVDGSIVYPDGQARTMRCYICRRYRKIPRNVNWMCKDCGMPLCRIDRGRPMTCLVEHQCSTDAYLGCGYMPRGKKQWKMPDSLKVFRNTRRK